MSMPGKGCKNRIPGKFRDGNLCASKTTSHLVVRHDWNGDCRLTSKIAACTTAGRSTMQGRFPYDSLPAAWIPVTSSGYLNPFDKFWGACVAVPPTHRLQALSQQLLGTGKIHVQFLFTIFHPNRVWSIWNCKTYLHCQILVVPNYFPTSYHCLPVGCQKKSRLATQPCGCKKERETWHRRALWLGHAPSLWWPVRPPKMNLEPTLPTWGKKTIFNRKYTPKAWSYEVAIKSGHPPKQISLACQEPKI